MADLGSALWTEADVNNNAAPPDGWAEGMPPSGVNNSARANMGAEKRWWNRSNAIKTTVGTSTAYTLTYDVAAAAYYDGELTAFVVHTACGANPTLNINGLGARNLRKWVGTFANLGSADLAVNQVVVARYNLASTTFDIIVGGGGSVPTGATMEFAGTVVPDGWLLCNGQAVSRSTFAGLFAVIGTSHGAGDGLTTFNVPNHVNKFVRGGTPGTTGGADTHAHTTSGTISGTASGGTTTAIGGGGQAGGVGANVVTTEHTHNLLGVTVSGSSSGSTNVVANIPAFVAENKIIKT